MDIPVAPGPAPQDAPGLSGQQIVSAAQKLPPDDLRALFQGISPQATEAMEKIPELADFANFIESGGRSTQEDRDSPDAAGKKPGLAIIIGVGRQRDPRADVAQAAAQHGLR